MKLNYLIEKHLPDLEFIKKNPTAKQYRVETIDLTTAHADKPINEVGNCLSVNVLPTEEGKYAKVKINSLENQDITLKQGMRIETTIHTLFITNDAFATGNMELVIGLALKVI